MSDTYNLGPTVPALFRAHEERYQEAQQRIATLEQQNKELVAALEILMMWQVKNVHVWENPAYDFAADTIAKVKQP